MATTKKADTPVNPVREHAERALSRAKSEADRLGRIAALPECPIDVGDALRQLGRAHVEAAAKYVSETLPGFREWAQHGFTFKPSELRSDAESVGVDLDSIFS